ncbi:MAG: nuclear transport factor 2 family protein [Actinobacteria bacterium]|nr:MAG: nuclear transport factor 2 family protein [Actinomycetota bacterium]
MWPARGLIGRDRITWPTVSRENIELTRQVIEAYNRRDIEAIRALNDPDVELDWSASRGFDAGVYRGIGAVLDFYDNFYDTFEAVTVEPQRFIEAGDSVVVPNSGRVRGREGIEAIARSALVFTFRDNRVARVCLYQETENALEAVGLRS